MYSYFILSRYIIYVNKYACTEVHLYMQTTNMNVCICICICIYLHVYIRKYAYSKKLETTYAKYISHMYFCRYANNISKYLNMSLGQKKSIHVRSWKYATMQLCLSACLAGCLTVCLYAYMHSSMLVFMCTSCVHIMYT